MEYSRVWFRGFATKCGWSCRKIMPALKSDARPQTALADNASQNVGGDADGPTVATHHPTVIQRLVLLNEKSPAPFETFLFPHSMCCVVCVCVVCVCVCVSVRVCECVCAVVLLC